jgi:hypothetical protein
MSALRQNVAFAGTQHFGRFQTSRLKRSGQAQSFVDAFTSSTIGWAVAEWMKQRPAVRLEVGAV